MTEFLDKIDVAFLAKTLVWPFSLTLVYILLANFFAYLYVRKKNDQRFFDLAKRSLVYAPFIGVVYGSLAGSGMYLFEVFFDHSFDHGKAQAILIVIPICIFLMGAIGGLCKFFSVYKHYCRHSSQESD